MEVRQELEGDQRLEDISINVNVNQGRVILEGRTNRLSQKHIAGEAASKAMGVKDVINNISVIRGAEMDDATIVNEIRRAFAAQGLNKDEIEVECNNGKVYIYGIASEEEEKRLEGAAKSVDGVKYLESYIDTVKGELDRAAYAILKAKKAFEEHDLLKEQPINIYEDKGYLVLKGYVNDTRVKQELDKVLHSVLEEFGDDFIGVDNKIRVE